MKRIEFYRTLEVVNRWNILSSEREKRGHEKLPKQLIVSIYLGMAMRNFGGQRRTLWGGGWAGRVAKGNTVM